MRINPSLNYHALPSPGSKAPDRLRPLSLWIEFSGSLRCLSSLAPYPSTLWKGSDSPSAINPLYYHPSDIHDCLAGLFSGERLPPHGARVPPRHLSPPPFAGAFLPRWLSSYVEIGECTSGIRNSGLSYPGFRVIWNANEICSWYDDGYYYCAPRAWYDWGRWVALAVIVATSFLIFFLFAYVESS